MEASERGIEWLGGLVRVSVEIKIRMRVKVTIRVKLGSEDYFPDVSRFVVYSGKSL